MYFRKDLNQKPILLRSFLQVYGGFNNLSSLNDKTHGFIDEMKFFMDELI